MFKNTYQSGFISILFAGGSRPLGIWGQIVKNGHIRRVTDEDVQTLALEVMGTNVATTYIVCPADLKQTLGIRLPFFIMIVKNMKKYFTFEITVMGSSYLETLRVQIHANVRIRRIYFSDRLYAEDEMPHEFKLYVPITSQKDKGKGKPKIPVEDKMTGADKARVSAVPEEKPEEKEAEAEPSAAQPTPTETPREVEQLVEPVLVASQEGAPEGEETEVPPEEGVPEEVFEGMASGEDETEGPVEEVIDDLAAGPTEVPTEEIPPSDTEEPTPSEAPSEAPTETEAPPSDAEPATE